MRPLVDRQREQKHDPPQNHLLRVGAVEAHARPCLGAKAPRLVAAERLAGIDRRSGSIPSLVRMWRARGHTLCAAAEGCITLGSTASSQLPFVPPPPQISPRAAPDESTIAAVSPIDLHDPTSTSTPP